MNRRYAISFVAMTLLLIPISGGLQATLQNCPVISAGAETVGAGGSLTNIGQSMIGRSSGGGINLHAGAIPCYLFNTPVSISQWRTVRTHSGPVDLAIVLDPAASGNGNTGPTVETRSGGVQRIEVDFSAPVTIVNVAGVSVVGQTTSYPGGVLGAPVAYVPTSVVMADGDTLAINFNPGILPDETCFTIMLGAGAISNIISGDNNCNIRSLLADTTMSGVVNLSDVLWTQSKIGQTAAANPQHDITLSGGNIMIDHALFIKGRVASPPHQALCP